ncbi:ATP-binding cassette domain-containing protein [Orrella sp. JC864]|uniref:ATP-binding cassette domain-containing protein n=1 Tax=Orrella sp. JC864 TaxID=3120298 RepID=UPI003009A13B
MNVASREVLRTVMRALWRNRGRTAVAVVLLVCAKLMMVLVPVALKHIVDALSAAPAALTLPVFLLLGYALLRFAGSALTELRDLVFARVAQRCAADFTLRMFDHVLRLGARFHASRQTGVLARDIERGTAGVAFLLGTGLFTLLPTLVEIVTVVGVLVAGYDVRFALVVAATFGLYFFCTFFLTERRTAVLRELNELDSSAGGTLVDSLLNYEAAKVNANEALEGQRMRSVLMRWVDAGIRNQRSLSALHVAQSAIIAAGVATVMLMAGQAVAAGTMTVGDLVLVNAYIIQICLPLNTLGLVFRQSKEAFINAERVCGLLALPLEPAGAAALPPVRPGQGSVRFEHVSFGYEPGRQVLWDVDFEVPAGATVAVVGGSGSGKSTLARLLLRFYEPDAGRVLVDGQDIATAEPASLRRSLGLVPQDTLLFNETIAYNIGYGRPQASREEIVEAARGARVHDFIQALPAGYDTVVGERGVKLSGGERQRVAIARALLKNPPIMIFDEATSALDTRTERAIQTELDRMAQGRTTLVIAHRLSTIVDADLILVMDHGRVVEQGTHAQLMAQDGMYAQMWALQRQQHALDDTGERLSRQPVNLVAVVAGVLDAARELTVRKAVNLYTTISDQAARITADPSTVQQLVWDLCAYAIGVAPPGGRVEITLAREGALTRLSVGTGGPGAPGPAPVRADAQDAPFAAGPPGEGLHAPEPARIAARMESLGGAYAWQPTPDGGQRHSLSFPLRAVAPAQPADEGQEIDLAGARVLVVDDQAEARELLAALLQGHHAEPVGCASGEQALSWLQSQAPARWPDVLICDISLGDMEGYEVIAGVRAMEAQRGASLSDRLPAIALSGHARSEDRMRALLAGFQLHLAKPVDTGELLAAVSGLRRSAARPAGPGAAAAGGE